MAIQNNLAQFRQKRGLSAIKLAKEIGVSRQTIYAMETGTYVPNTLLALKLAQVLEVTVEDLFRLEAAEVPGSHGGRGTAARGAGPPAGTAGAIVRCGRQAGRGSAGAERLEPAAGRCRP